MKITITKNEREFDVTAAWRIIGQLLSKPNAVIGLSTGQTTIGMHGIVSEIFSKYPFDVSRVTLFNVDELTNLPREYSGSCYTMILNQIAGPLGLRERHRSRNTQSGLRSFVTHLSLPSLMSEGVAS